MQSDKQIFERDLLHRVRQGDEEAFAQLFYAYKRKLFSFVHGFMDGSQRAEDIVQDVFLKIWIHRDKLDEIDNFSAYLFRMVHNRVIDHLKRRSRETLLRATSFDTETADFHSPEYLLREKEVLAKIREAVDSLSPQQRRIYQLHREQGLKQQEIARMLNLSLSTVQNHMLCALNGIRHYLAAYYVSVSLACLLIAEFVPV